METKFDDSLLDDGLLEVMKLNSCGWQAVSHVKWAYVSKGKEILPPVSREEAILFIIAFQ
jgi:hypothetical protein